MNIRKTWPVGATALALIMTAPSSLAKDVGGDIEQGPSGGEQEILSIEAQIPQLLEFEINDGLGDDKSGVSDGTITIAHENALASTALGHGSVNACVFSNLSASNEYKMSVSLLHVSDNEVRTGVAGGLVLINSYTQEEMPFTLEFKNQGGAVTTFSDNGDSFDLSGDYGDDSCSDGDYDSEFTVRLPTDGKVGDYTAGSYTNELTILVEPPVIDNGDGGDGGGGVEGQIPIE